MKKTIAFLDGINENAGKLFAWSASFLIWIIMIDVIMRYVFNHSYVWMLELEIYLFALTFLMSAGYAFKHEKHVRVDVFYSGLSPKSKAKVDLLGGLFLLMPWCIISIIVCFKYALASWKVGETSAQPGGLPAIYLLKFCLVLCFLLLMIAAIASILRSIYTIKNPEISLHSSDQKSKN